MKKTLVLAIALVCGFLNPQIIAAPDQYAGSARYSLSGAAPVALAATTSNTPAKTPTSSPESGEAATAPEGTSPNALYPDSKTDTATATEECSSVADSGGLIPCGRNTNDPNTAWDECKPCDFCSFALSLQLIVNYAVKIVGLLTLIAIVLGQLIAMTAVGQTSTMVSIKSVLGSALMGFGYVLAAWMIVNSIFAFIGFTDPLDGEWFTIC